MHGCMYVLYVTFDGGIKMVLGFFCHFTSFFA